MSNDLTQNKQLTSTDKPKRNPNSTFVALLLVCLILSTISLGLSIHNTITINRGKTLSAIPEDFENTNYEATDDSEESSYGLPTNASSIENIYISYNDYNDSIDISPEQISYSTYNTDEDILHDTTKQIDATETFQYFFDNCLQFLKKEETSEEEISEDSSWTIEVYTTNNTYSYTSGTEIPEWLEKFLEKLNAENRS